MKSIVTTGILLAGGLMVAACQPRVPGQPPMPPQPPQPPQSISLAGTEWGPPNNQFDQFIRFTSENEVSGQNGCNGFFGSYNIQGNRIMFDPLATTRRACQGPRNQAENQFMALIGQTQFVNATPYELRMIGYDGRVLAVLQRRDWD